MIHAFIDVRIYVRKISVRTIFRTRRETVTKRDGIWNEFSKCQTKHKHSYTYTHTNANTHSVVSATENMCVQISYEHAHIQLSLSVSLSVPFLCALLVCVCTHDGIVYTMSLSPFSFEHTLTSYIFIHV